MFPTVHGIVSQGGVAEVQPDLPDELTPSENNPLIPSGTWGFGSVVKDGGTYYAFLHGTDDRIYLYTASERDGPFTLHTEVLRASQGWENGAVGVPYAWKDGDTWYMLYRGGIAGILDQTGLATASSPAGPWTKHAGNPVIPGSVTNGWGSNHDGKAETTGPIKIDDTYYVIVETGLSTGSHDRRSGIFTSTDLVNWSPVDGNPLFQGGRFCGFIFQYSGLYWLITPHYTNIGAGENETEFELYRCPRPTFRPDEREFVGVLYAAADRETGWDSADMDTPCVLTQDVERVVTDELLIYYAGKGDDGTWGMGLLESGDPEHALGVLKGIAVMHIGADDWNAGTTTGSLTVTGRDPLIAQEVFTDTGGGLGTTQRVGNTFKVNETVRGISIEQYVHVKNTADATKDFIMRLYDQDISGQAPIDGPMPIATARAAPITTSGWVRFDFPDAVVEADTTYSFTLGTVAAMSPEPYDNRGSSANPYPDGSYLFWSNFNEYRINAAWDVAFRVAPHGSGVGGAGTFESAEIDLSPAGTASGVTRISWAADEPEDTSITVEVALSTDGGNSWGSWTPVSNGGTIPGIASSADLTDYRLKYKATLASTAPGKTPVLRRVLIEVQGS